MEDNMKIEYIRRLKKKTRGRRQNKKDKEDKIWRESRQVGLNIFLLLLLACLGSLVWDWPSRPPSIEHWRQLAD
jgi:hypothetical protein